MTSRGRTAAEAAELHDQELALFLAVHCDRAPGVLWPEHEHPAYRPAPAAAALKLLASSLERSTGRSVRTVCEGGKGRTVRYGAVPDHVMIHQTAGVGDWHVSAPLSTASTASGTEAETALRCRLRASEVLYVPPQHTWHADLSRTARYLLTYLGATVAPDSAPPPPPVRRIPAEGVDPRER